MGRTITLRKKEIFFNGNKSVILEEKSDDYQYVEVTFNNGKEKVYIGSYFTAYSIDKEWVEFNSEYIAIMKFVYGDEYVGPQVVKMFNIKSEQFIDGSVEELLELYAHSFGKNIVVTTKNKENNSELIRKYRPNK